MAEYILRLADVERAYEESCERVRELQRRFNEADLNLRVAKRNSDEMLEVLKQARQLANGEHPAQLKAAGQ
jgi:hypothetical protein